MTERNPLNRRSFLVSVVGAAAGGGALATVAASHSQAQHGTPKIDIMPRVCARRTGRTDSDGSLTRTGDARGCGQTGQTDRDATDHPRYGRGMTDVDQSDREGQGRGGNGMTDRDPTDSIGRGQGRRGRAGPSGVTDSDPRDHAGYGRNAGAPRQTGSGQRVWTGRNDSDSGGRADEAGYGR